ncbi:MAG: hypothetical protein ACKVP0_20085 [Pirellulaceae bacterium]
MAAFEYRQAEEVRDAFAKQGVKYFFLGKSAAILLGFPDTTQDADLFPDRSPENGQAIVRALGDLGFTLTPEEESQIIRGKDFVQLKTGPFELTPIFSLTKVTAPSRGMSLALVSPFVTARRFDVN